MKKIFPLLLALPLFLVSCLGDGEQSSTMQMNAEMVQIKRNSEGSKLNTAKYYFEMVLDENPYINIRIYDTDVTSATMYIQGLPLNISTSLGYTFTAPTVIPTDGINSLNGITITDLYGQYNGYTLDLRYTLNGNTSVVAIPNGVVYNYTEITTTSLDNSGEAFNYDESVAVFEYRVNSDSALVDMTLRNIKFAEEQPVTQAMTFPSIKLTPSITGTMIELKADSIIPEISNVPYPKYKITNFSATTDPSFSPISFFSSENISGTFECMGQKVTFKARHFKPQEE